MRLFSLIHVALALAASPLLVGIINRTKAFTAGRKGQPLLQPYYDIVKLLRKGAVYSRTTTWVFRAGPIVGLATTLCALLVLPFAGTAATVSFRGDLVLFAYLLALGRFFTVIAALDTGSAFEGMGASREVTFSALAEPAFLLALVVLATQSHSASLTAMYAIVPTAWVKTASAMVLVASALLLVFLAENSRIPVDDPTTHLELTMIHEVMVLDHGGPDFGLIEYAAALKLWLLGALFAGVVNPYLSGNTIVDTVVALFTMVFLAVLVGAIESCMARLRLLRVPQLLVGAATCSVIALALVLR